MLKILFRPTKGKQQVSPEVILYKSYNLNPVDFVIGDEVAVTFEASFLIDGQPVSPFNVNIDAEQDGYETELCYVNYPNAQTISRQVTFTADYDKSDDFGVWMYVTWRAGEEPVVYEMNFNPDL